MPSRSEKSPHSELYYGVLFVVELRHKARGGPFPHCSHSSGSVEYTREPGTIRQECGKDKNIYHACMYFSLRSVAIAALLYTWCIIWSPFLYASHKPTISPAVLTAAATAETAPFSLRIIMRTYSSRCAKRGAGAKSSFSRAYVKSVFFLIVCLKKINKLANGQFVKRFVLLKHGQRNARKTIKK